MKPALILPVALGAAVCASVITSIALAPAPRAAEPAGAPAAELAEIRDLIARVEQRQRDFERTLGDLREDTPLAAGAGRLPVGEIERAVARYMDGQGVPPAGAPSDDLVGAGDAFEDPPQSVENLLHALLEENLDTVAWTELWTQIREEGRLDEVIAAFEERAERLADDPDAQVDLGTAYLQKIFEAGSSGPAAGLWAMKADKAFDAALALDDHHWDARFHKAVSLSHWPPVWGKQPAAIQHFEQLVGQQAEGPSDPRFAQTHLLLGNMYQQIGQPDKAIEAWQNGLALYPDDESLRAQLEISGR